MSVILSNSILFLRDVIWVNVTKIFQSWNAMNAKALGIEVLMAINIHIY